MSEFPDSVTDRAVRDGKHDDFTLVVYLTHVSGFVSDSANLHPLPLTLVGTVRAFTLELSNIARHTKKAADPMRIDGLK